MKKNIWEKKIPTFVGLLLLTLIVGLTTLLSQYTTSFFTRASPNKAPQNIKVTNVTDSSFALVWTTESKTIGSLKVDTTAEGTGKTVLDDQDQLVAQPTPRSVHFTTVTNLSPNTQYFYQIISDGASYNNNGVSFSIKTALPLPKDIVDEKAIKGSVVAPDGAPARGIVSFSIEGSQTLSTFVKDGGSYLIPISFLRTINLATYYSLDDKMVAELTIIGEDLSRSIVKLFVNNLSLPTITLGKDYDFTLTLPTPTLGATSSSSFQSPEPIEIDFVDVLSPKQGEIFTDQTPLFRGSAPKGAKLQIVIESQQKIEALVTVSQNGTWTFQPDTPLEPGTHTITLRVPDQNGIVQVLTRTFSILPPGVQVAEAATPSATPTQGVTPLPTLTPQATPTISATVSPSLTPTLAASPSSKGGISPTIQPIPQSGLPIPSVIIGASGVMLSLIGAALLLKK